MRETSAQVWEAINEEGLVGDLQASVLEVLSKAPHALTVAEIAGKLGTHKNHISGRCSELVRAGYVKEGDKRPCSVTGRTVLTFRELQEGEELTKKLGKCGLDVDVEGGLITVYFDGKVISKHKKFKDAEEAFKTCYMEHKKSIY